MPTMLVEIPDCAENIGRPVVYQVLRQLAVQNGLPQDLNIRYMGQNQALPVTGSTLDDQGAGPRFPGTENITIDVTEDYDADRVSNTFVNYPDQPPIFTDKPLGVYIRPVYQRVKVNISVKYVAKDKTTAEAWVRTMKRRCTQQVTIFPHLVDYHYAIPPTMLRLLFDIHTNREAVAPLNEDTGKWFSRCLTPRFTVARDKNGGNPTFVIREKQVRLLGMYDFGAEVAKAEKDNDVGNWSISFNYLFSYDRVESCTMKYPIIVHNALLPSEWLFKERVYDPDNFFSQGGFQMDLLQKYFTYNEHLGGRILPPPGLSVPYFDDWPSPKMPPYYVSLLRILNAVNLNSPKEIVSLNNLSSYRFKELCLPYMADLPIALAQRGESLFYLRFYEGDKDIGGPRLVVAKDLGIMAMNDLDPTKIYHLCVDLLCDPSQLSQAALRRLMKYGRFVWLYLKTIYPHIKDSDLPPINPDGSISFDGMLASMSSQNTGRIIPPVNRMAQMFKYGFGPTVNFTNNLVLWPLVGQFVICTDRSKKNA